MAGVDLRTVQELLGHKNILMPMRYAHLSPDHKRTAIDMLEQRFSDQSPTSFHNTTHLVELREATKHETIQQVI
jgi:hypothetical protein